MKSPKLSLLAIFGFVTLVLMGSLLLSFNKIDAFSTGDFPGVNVINNPGDVDGADDPVNRGYNDLGGSGWTGGGNKGGGSNGGSTTPVITPSVNTDSVIVVVTAAPGEPSGYLTASDDSCIIRADKNSCNVEFNWGTTNGVGTSSVTRNPEEGFTIQNADSGANVPLPVYHGISNFFLYNNGLKLAETSVGASCEAGTTWVAGEGKCILDVAVENFSTPNCTIAIGESSCTSNISWNISGGYGDFSLTTPTNIVVSSSKSGSTNYTISYPSRSFSLINNTNVLKGSTSYADCIAGSSWNASQGKCVATNVIGTISSTSCVIASGENTCASSVSWST
ncbi:MAG: hypothetical protein EOM85_02940, partial [Candidatus Moranbacteria bacterium]|nr:hypothetical protein [Candidatus Moranbacteria bacterium]